LETISNRDFFAGHLRLDYFGIPAERSLRRETKKAQIADGKKSAAGIVV